jgi:hypothetical protein
LCGGANLLGEVVPGLAYVVWQQSAASLGGAIKDFTEVSSWFFDISE